MFLLIEKAIKTLKGETNFDISKPLIFEDFVVIIQQNQKISILYKGNEILKNLWFQATHFKMDAKNYKVKKISTFDLNFKFQKNKKKLFMMFEHTNPFFEFRGSISLTFKKNEFICEHRYFTNKKIHARITSFMQFDSSFEESVDYQTLKSSLFSKMIKLESTQYNWSKDGNVITNAARMQETKKGNKELIVKYNNKGHQTLKLSIGEINEKV